MSVPRVHVDSLEEFVGGLTPQQLHCRTYGHSMAAWNVEIVALEGGGSAYEVTLRCKCRVMRRILVGETGRALASHHDYSGAPGYLAGGIGRITGDSRNLLRLTYVQQLLGKKTKK